MPPARPSRDRRAVLRRMVTFAVLPALVVSLVAAVAAWAVRGEWSALSALLGGLLGAGVFLAGLLGIAGVVAGPAAASMAGAFAVLVLQLVVAGAVLFLISRLAWADMLSLGVAFLASGLAFQVGVVTGYAGARRLTFGEDPEAGGLR